MPDLLKYPFNIEPQKSSQIPASNKTDEVPKNPDLTNLKKTDVIKTQKQDLKQLKTPKPPAEIVQKTTPIGRQQIATARSGPQSQTVPNLVTGNYPYSIIVASCRLNKSAQEVVTQYRKKGLIAYIVKVDLDSNGLWWRVFTGQYKNRDEALKAKKEFNLKDSLIKKTPYTNLVGIFNSEEQSVAMAQRVEKLGFSPYIIRAQDDTWRLVTGAFFTRDGAKPQKDELAAKGIQSQIVER